VHSNLEFTAEVCLCSAANAARKFQTIRSSVENAEIRLRAAG